jgi:ADP-ribosyl-[dinitrogen reductase] hydrolase
MRKYPVIFFITAGKLEVMTTSERLKGGLYGLLVGDALGVPYEFHEPEDLPPLQEIEFGPPHSFQRTHASVKAGTWSDDGAQALCLLASLLHCHKFDAEDFANRLINWYEHGYMAVDNYVFDVGIQTAKAIQNLQRGISPLEAGSNEQYSQGNGSLMRVLPLALWHQGSDAELVQDAHNQSKVTHGHLNVQVCCAFYCLWARRVLEQHSNPWEDASKTLQQLYESQSPYQQAFDNILRDDIMRTPTGGGFVIDSLFSAKWALEQGSYEQVAKAAVSLGHDTDTTACIAGGIAGIRDGVSAIPQRWLEYLREKDVAEALLEQLLKRHL